MLDSGAFSAWRLGKEIDLIEYCNFIKKNQEWIECYVNLDVIIPNDPEEAASQGFDNLITMRKHGLNPIPVWHIKEDIKWLYKMLDLGCDYIGISATSIDSYVSVDKWYDLIFPHLVDSNGDPIVKYHSFGDIRDKVLLKYPWYSADASSWLVSQRYGTVNIPGLDKRFFYGKKYTKNNKNQIYLESLNGEELQLLTSILDKYEITMDMLNENRDNRFGFILKTFLQGKYYQQIAHKVESKIPIKYQNNQSFFQQYSNKQGVEQSEFNFYLGCTLNSSALVAAYRCEHPYFLVSYYYMNDRYEKDLTNFYHNPDQTLRNSPIYNKYMLLFDQLLTKKAA